MMKSSSNSCSIEEEFVIAEGFELQSNHEWMYDKNLKIGPNKRRVAQVLKKSETAGTLTLKWYFDHSDTRCLCMASDSYHHSPLEVFQTNEVQELPMACLLGSCLFLEWPEVDSTGQFLGRQDRNPNEFICLSAFDPLGDCIRKLPKYKAYYLHIPEIVLTHPVREANKERETTERCLDEYFYHRGLSLVRINCADFFRSI